MTQAATDPIAEAFRARAARGAPPDPIAEAFRQREARRALAPPGLPTPAQVIASAGGISARPAGPRPTVEQRLAAAATGVLAQPQPEFGPPPAEPIPIDTGIVAGALRGAAQLAEAVPRLGAMAQAAQGNLPAAAGLGAVADQVGQIGQAIPKSPEAQGFNPGRIRWWTENLGEQIPNMAAGLATGGGAAALGLGRAAQLAAAVMPTFGLEAAEAYKQTKNPAIGIGVGLVNAALDLVPFSQLFTENPAGRAILRRLGMEAAPRFIQRAVSAAPAEAAAESIQELTQALGAYAGGDPAALEGVGERMAGAGLLGLAAGGGAAAVMPGGMPSRTRAAEGMAPTRVTPPGVPAPEPDWAREVSTDDLRRMAREVGARDRGKRDELVAEIAKRRPPVPLTPPDSALPEWVRGTIDDLNAQAERAGIADQIEELSAQRLTAAEVARRLNTDKPTVFAVRSKRGIPSMDQQTEFEAWVRGRESATAAAPAETPAGTSPPATAGPTTQTQGPGGQTDPAASPQSATGVTEALGSLEGATGQAPESLRDRARREAAETAAAMRGRQSAQEPTDAQGSRRAAEAPGGQEGAAGREGGAVRLRDDAEEGAAQAVQEETRPGAEPVRGVPAAEPAPGVAAKPHRFSTTQFNLPEDLAAEATRIADSIPDDDLAPDGREDKPHVTVKYGLEIDEAEAVARALEGQGPIRVRLGDTTLFENDEHDVVKVDVKGPALKALNKRIADALPHQDTQREYIPHLTLAYVKKGRGKKYVGRTSLSGREIRIDRIVFSDRNRNETVIPLRGGTAPTPPTQETPDEEGQRQGRPQGLLTEQAPEATAQGPVSVRLPRPATAKQRERLKAAGFAKQDVTGKVWEAPRSAEAERVAGDLVPAPRGLTKAPERVGPASSQGTEGDPASTAGADLVSHRAPHLMTQAALVAELEAGGVEVPQGIKTPRRELISGVRELRAMQGAVDSPPVSQPEGAGPTSPPPQEPQGTGGISDKSPRRINPSSLIFREKDQSNLAEVRKWLTADVDPDLIPPLVAVRTEKGLEILDGHNRARVAREVGIDNVPVLTIDGRAYKELAKTFDDMEIVAGIVQRAGDWEHLSRLEQQFGGGRLMKLADQVEAKLDEIEASFDQPAPAKSGGDVAPFPDTGRTGSQPRKETWQMTKAEWLKTAPTEKARFLMETGTAHEIAVADALAEGKPVPLEVLAEYPGIRPTDWADLQSRDVGTVAAREQAASAKAKDDEYQANAARNAADFDRYRDHLANEAWKQTKAEYVGNRRGGNKRFRENEHRGAVAEAVEAGKPVPADVLKDYPDLAPKAEPVADRAALIDRIVAAARKRPLEVVERFQLKGSDGKWYSAGGFPVGVQSTGERRSIGFAYRTSEGTVVGKIHPTREEAEEAQRQRDDADSAEFRRELEQSSDEELRRQAEYWLKETAAAPSPDPTGAPPAKAAPDGDSVIRKQIRELVAKKYKSNTDEIRLRILKAKLAADPSKWTPGDGVGYYAGPATKDRLGSQINRGFQVVQIDPSDKTALVRQVADTGLTASGGNDDRVGDQWIGIEMLVRDRRYDRPGRGTEASASAKGDVETDGDTVTVSFPRPPKWYIRQRLKDAGFRWDSESQSWKAPRSDATEALASELGRIAAGTKRIGDTSRPTEAPLASVTDLRGFDVGMSPMQRGKAIAALNRTLGNQGRVVPRRQIVEEKVGAGATIRTAANGERRLMTPDGAYLTDGQLGSIAFDYAEHLIKQRDEGSPDKGVARESNPSLLGPQPGVQASTPATPTKPGDRSEPRGATPPKEPWAMTATEFRKRYYQHNILRPDAPEVGPEGFKSGIGPNVVPVTAGPPTDIMQQRYGTKAGRPIYLVPREWVRDTPNGPKIKNGWKPRPEDRLVPERDHQPVHELIVKQAIAQGKTVPPEVLADYPDLGTTGASDARTEATEPADLRLGEGGAGGLRAGDARGEGGARGREEVALEQVGGTKPSLTQRIADKAASVERAAADRIKKRRIPRGRESGATTLLDDIIDTGIMVGARLVKIGAARAGRVMQTARAVLTELNRPDLSPHIPDILRVARRIVRRSKDDAGVFAADRFEAAVADALDRKADDPPRPRVVIAETTGAGRKEPKTLTQSEAFVRSLRREARAAREAYKVAQAEARNRLGVLTQELQRQVRTTGLRGAIAERAKARAEEEKRRTQDELREEALTLVRNHAPREVRSKLLEAVARATTPHRLLVVARRLRKEMALLEARRAASQAAKVGKRDLGALEPEMRQEADAALGAIRRLRAELKAMHKGGKADVDRIEVIRDELRAAMNAVKSLLHQQRTLDTVRIRGEKVEAQRYRDEIESRLAEARELPTPERGAPEPSGLVRLLRNRTNWESMMRALDAWKGGGPSLRLFNEALRGRREAIRITRDFRRQFDAIVRRNGYRSLGQFQAEVSGTLGRASQMMVDVAIGGRSRITLGEAAYLYASMKDAGFQDRMRSGQPLQFRDNPTGQPWNLTQRDLYAIEEAVPENVRRIVDEAKEAFDATFFRRMSNVNKRLKGYHLNKVPGYWGIKLNRNYSEGRGTPFSWRRAVIRAQEEAGFMQERVGPSRTPILVGDFGTDIVLRARSAATVIGKAEVTKLLARTLLHPSIQTAVSRRFGESMVKRIERRLSLYSGGELFREADVPVLRTLQSFWARGKTQLWFPTWIRNATAGSIRMLNDLPVLGGVRAAVQRPTWTEYRELVEHSPELWERWEGHSLSGFYDPGATDAEAKFTQAMGATLRQLAETAREMKSLRLGEVLTSAREMGKPWRAVLDSLTVGNYFDAAGAILAYRYFKTQAPAHWSDEAKKRWAAQRATRVFERASNTAALEYANDVQLDARESFLVQSLIPFTGDTAKAMNMIAEAKHRGTKARTAGVLAASAIASSLVSVLWALALGDEKEKAVGAGARRLAQEAVSLIPFFGTGLQHIVAQIGSKRPTAPELEVPIVELANGLVGAGQKIITAAERMDGLEGREKLTAGDLLLRATADVGNIAAEASGIPIGYYFAVKKALKNWGVIEE